MPGKNKDASAGRGTHRTPYRHAGDQPAFRQPASDQITVFLMIPHKAWAMAMIALPTIVLLSALPTRAARCSKEYQGQLRAAT